MTNPQKRLFDVKIRMIHCMQRIYTGIWQTLALYQIWTFGPTNCTNNQEHKLFNL